MYGSRGMSSAVGGRPPSTFAHSSASRACASGWRASSTQLQVSVSDSGSGIPAADLPHLPPNARQDAGLKLLPIESIEDAVVDLLGPPEP